MGVIENLGRFDEINSMFRDIAETLGLIPFESPTHPVPSEVKGRMS